MSRAVISVQHLEKRYRLGVIGGAMLGDEVAAWIARLRGRPDPRMPLDRQVDHQQVGAHFWALRDVSFDVRQGEILGVIGRNGAGKSTLLKILSRITTPTRGVVRMKGRVSSLLEVGTGFNLELTGRENIHLNGAILGMRKAEIRAKLDEIIAFSGVEQHIDTPVKRYSSGMKVRLGFAVAAHLEPEILIVDEVLAVGDAEFQRKCIGRMKDVASSGRTILFVSHNMTAIRTLCSRILWLHNGAVRADGDPDNVVRDYANTYTRHLGEIVWPVENAPQMAGISLRRVAIAREGDEPLTWRMPFRIEIDVTNTTSLGEELSVGINLLNDENVMAFGSSIKEDPSIVLTTGTHRLCCHVPGELLNVGDYRVTVNVFRSGKRLFSVEEAVAFEVHDTERNVPWYGRSKGVFRPVLKWTSGTHELVR